MASNAELASKAHELADKLGHPVRTDGLTNKKLSELVGELEERVARAEKGPPPAPPEDGAQDAFGGGPPTSKPDVKPVSLKYPLQVAPGRNVACRAGVFGPGQRIERKWFRTEGERRLLDGLIRSGSVLEGPDGSAEPSGG